MKLVLSTWASRRLAPDKSAESRIASSKQAPAMSEPLKSTPARFAAFSTYTELGTLKHKL